MPSDAPEVDVIKLTPNKLGNVVTLSNESIADAPVDEVDAIGIALTRAIANKLDATAFSAAAARPIAPAGPR